MNKFERQGAILSLVREFRLSTQADVVQALRERGIEAVQTTVSRDIAQLGLMKVRTADGQLVYALPGAADLDRLSELTGALRRWTTSMEAAGNLVVVKTPSGYAAPLADAIDAAAPGDVAGTIAGENTVFVCAREGVSGADLAAQLRHHLKGDT